MQTLSIRIPDEDFQWLLSLQDSDAKTPSEKLRAVLAQARHQDTGIENYESCASWMRTMVQPLASAIASLERREKAHSDPLASAVEWAPQIMASLVAERPAAALTRAEAEEREAIVLQQCFRMLAAMLRAGISTAPAAFDPKRFETYVQDIVELAAIISTQQGKE